MAGKLVMVVDDESAYRRLYADTLKAAGFETAEAGSGIEAVEALSRGLSPEMILSDMKMPGMDGMELLRKAREARPNIPFLMITAYPDLRDAVKAMKTGALDYLEKPVDLDELVAAVCDALGVEQGKGSGMDAIPKEALAGMVVESPSMKMLVADAYRVAGSDVNVLIGGESGVGKEVLANFIHKCSPRAKGRFLALNCAAIPASLLAGELFGHRKGAFTGAHCDRAGAFREAHGGTLFLDEIGEMPLELQSSLLRALETRRVTPLGGGAEVPADARVLAASNKNLKEEVDAGRFRLDLYYRLNVVAFDIPPLRERPEDVMALCRIFLGKGGRQKRLSPAAARLIMAHSWPGNVRELANAMERACILSGTEVVIPEHLPHGVRDARPPSPEGAPSSVKTVVEAEADAIKAALSRTGGNRTKAAEMLGISRRALIYKIKGLGL